MGQGAVRAAIQRSIESAQLPLVGTVFSGRAYIDEQDYETNAAQFYVQNTYGSACVVVVNLPGPDRRYRLSLTGRQTVNDFNIHPVVLELFFASRSGDPIQAQHDYDTVVDALVPFIRNNPTMSAADVVWSAGEYQKGVQHTQSSPFTLEDGMTVFINGIVTFDAWEQILGVGV
jgi:hypothetical protein